VIEFFEHALAAFEITQACFGQRKIARGAIDEARMQMGFKHGDRAGDERIRDIELLGGAAKALRFRNPDKNAHGVYLVHRIRLVCMCRLNGRYTVFYQQIPNIQCNADS
jgi:hypothetical protein